MILDLTTENLERLGFNNDEIKPLLSKKENYSLLNNLGSFYFDYIKNKIYTDIDKGRLILKKENYKRFPFSYPTLIPEYFEFNLKMYLDEHQILLATMFDKKEQTKEFIAKEVKEIKDIISSNQNYIDRYPNGNIEHKEIPIKIHKVYVSYLEKQTKEIAILENELKHKSFTDKNPQQKETNKPDEVLKNLHNDIFKDSAFEVWQSMFEKNKITESNYSTDIDFMFEVMKYNKLIHDNIGLTDIKKWINKVYEISFDKIRYTNPKSNANRKRLIIYNDIISK